MCEPTENNYFIVGLNIAVNFAAPDFNALQVFQNFRLDQDILSGPLSPI
jgi:hypothetical protein